MTHPFILGHMSLRRDAARNWDQIVETGRRLVDEGTPLRLNEVARAAAVGVATVYRHFPTPEALLETIALPGLEALAARGEHALTEDDPGTAFTGLLLAGIDALLADPAIPPVFSAPDHVLPRTAEVVARLAGLNTLLLDRAQRAGAIRPGLTAADITRLICGIVYAATLEPDAAARPALTHRYLDLLLTGLRT